MTFRPRPVRLRNFSSEPEELRGSLFAPHRPRYGVVTHALLAHAAHMRCALLCVDCPPVGAGNVSCDYDPWLRLLFSQVCVVTVCEHLNLV